MCVPWPWRAQITDQVGPQYLEVEIHMPGSPAVAGPALNRGSWLCSYLLSRKIKAVFFLSRVFVAPRVCLTAALGSCRHVTRVRGIQDKAGVLKNDVRPMADYLVKHSRFGDLLPVVACIVTIRGDSR